MIFLCISRFDIEEQEAKILKEFFSQSEIEAVKEEKDRKLDLVEFLPISDIEEEDHKIDNEDLIELVLDIVKRDKEPKPSLLQTVTQIRALGRKRKSREDDLFEYHQQY